MDSGVIGGGRTEGCCGVGGCLTLDDGEGAARGVITRGGLVR